MLSPEAVHDRSIRLLETTVVLRLLGAVGGVTSPPDEPAARNAAAAAAQGSCQPSEALADAAPAVVWIWSSAISLALGAPGTLSSIAQPLPAVMFAGLAVITAPSNRSPFAAVTLPLFGAVLVPCAATAPSSEPAVAMPAYSRMANRSVAVFVVDTVTVSAPPLMASA